MIKARMVRDAMARQRPPGAASGAQVLPGQDEISPVPIAAGSQPPVDPEVRARQAILHGPVLATMLGLAGPTILVLVAQVAVGVAETFYVSYLGTAALAGVALVFPILMLMTMMSNGGVGGGVASAVARAIGAGNVKFPAIVTLTSAAVLVLLSPALIFGIGPIPRLGIAGAGIAVTSFNVVAAVVLLRYLGSGRAVPALRRTRLEARLFRSILGVGLLSALGTVQFNLTVLLVTGAVGLFGTY